MQMVEIMGLARALLAFGGGIVVSRGLVDADTVQSITGGLLAVATGVWSVADKRKRR